MGLSSRGFWASNQSRPVVPAKKGLTWVVAMFSGPTNYPTSIVEVTKHLRKLGNWMTVVGFKPQNVSMFEDSDVNLILLPLSYVPVFSPIVFSLSSALLLPFVLLRNRSHVVFFQPDVSIIGCLPTVLTFKLLKTKFVLDIRSPPVETSGFSGSLKRFSFRLSVNVAKRAFDGLTIVTDMMRREFCNEFRMNPERVGVWTSGVNVEHFDPDLYVEDGRKLRKVLGLQDKFIVFYHGVLSENRGVFETVRSIGLLKQQHPQIVFFVVGEGPILAQIKDYVVKNNLGQNVVLHGRVPYSEVPKYIAMSDVCVVPLPNHPYWNTQSPLKLLEYLAMRKVVILSDIPAHRAVVGNDDVLFLKSVDPREIASSLVFAYENRTSLISYGNGGADIVKDKYSWEGVSKNLEEYVSNL